MPLVTGRRAGALVLALSLLAPASCATIPVGAGIGTDPCLLQQYQTRGFTAVKEMQRAVATLEGSVDVLKGPAYGIPGGQDAAAAQTALAEFLATTTTQWNLIRMGAHPAEGAAFYTDARSAIAALRVGTGMLMQAYEDSGDGDTRAADAVAGAGRAWFGRGRVGLAVAGESLADLHTYSTNC